MNVMALFEAVTDLAPGESARRKHEAISVMLRADGFGITPEGVKKWDIRSSIPGDWLVRLITAAKDRGRAVDLVDYI